MTQATLSIGVAAAPTSLAVNSPVSFTVTLDDLEPALPTGKITLMDGTTILATHRWWQPTAGHHIYQHQVQSDWQP